MHTQPHRSRFLVTGILVLVLAAAFTVKTNLTAAVDCVGKPYGYPGCPTRPASAAQSSSAGGITSCGNAILDDGEQCDKGRFNGKTDCGTDCRNLYCGDGIVTRDLNEECEPQTQEVYVEDEQGNLTTETQFTGSAQCGWYCQPPSCPSGGGACAGGCRLKYIGECAESSVSSSAGQSLTAVSASASSVSVSSSVAASGLWSSGAAPVCGNGTVDSGEECDDGNRNPVDSCTNDCRVPGCGDGIIHRGEECDDGNSDNSDGCSNACALPRCGDGIRHAREECDDGSRNSDTLAAACRTNCMIAHCGDGVLDAGERCDVGGKNSDTKPNACRTSCEPASCGDAVTDAGEECDDGNTSDTDGCTAFCKKSRCGDGVLQTSEQCDWGLRNSDTEPNACRASCKIPRCGDGVTDIGELCDGAKDCGKDCKLAGSASVSSAGRSSSVQKGGAPHAAAGVRVPVIPLTLASAGILIIAGTLLFRRKLVMLFARKTGMKMIDLDDIPLDQIEMPWHKW